MYRQSGGGEREKVERSPLKDSREVITVVSIASMDLCFKRSSRRRAKVWLQKRGVFFKQDLPGKEGDIWPWL